MVSELLKKVRRLEYQPWKVIEGVISGNYRSIFLGRGVEFSEVREYIPGDDIRTIDWGVTARFNSPYVKKFVEERDLSVFIAFDISSSNDFGKNQTKKDLGIEIAASLMAAALKNNDNIGICLFTDKIERFIPPRKGRKHFLRLITELLVYQAESKKTDLNAALTYIARVINRRSVIFVISDFIATDFEKPLKRLRGKHDLVLMQLNDPAEDRLPDIGYMLVEDAESGEQVVINTSEKEFRKSYEALIKKRRSDFLRNMRQLRMELVRISPDEPFFLTLKRYFASRKKRMVR